MPSDFSLPVELVELIVDRIVQSSKSTSSFKEKKACEKTLCKCLLVSRVFYRRARFHIFSEIDIRIRYGVTGTLDRLGALLDILRYQGHFVAFRKLCADVRTFRLDLDKTNSTDCCIILNSAELVEVLRELQAPESNLRTVCVGRRKATLHSLNWRCLEAGFVRAFHGLCHVPTLERLEIRRICGLPTRFLRRSPIKHLSMDNVAFHEYSTEQLQGQGFASNYYDGSPDPSILDSLEIYLSWIPDVHKIFFASTDTEPSHSIFCNLRNLSIKISNDWHHNQQELLQDLLEQSSSSLVTLQIQNFNDIPLPLDLLPCTKLKQLSLSILSSNENDPFLLDFNDLWSMTVPKTGIPYPFDSLYFSLPYSSTTHTGKFDQLFRIPPASFWRSLYSYFSALQGESPTRRIHLSVYLIDSMERNRAEEMEGKVRKCLAHTFYPFLSSRSDRFKCDVVCGSKGLASQTLHDGSLAASW